MNPKRRQVEELILSTIKKLITGDKNIRLYIDLFKSMNDKQFDEFMLKLKNKEITLSVIIPNGDTTTTVNMENTFKVAKSLGFDFFQRLHIGATEDTPAYITPNKYMVLKTPVKRVSQRLDKKISIFKNNKNIDSITGQVKNDSKASKLTAPEIQVLLGMGLQDTTSELLKIRGGDINANTAMNKMLLQNGIAYQSEANKYSSGVESTKVLKTYLASAHIKSTL